MPVHDPDVQNLPFFSTSPAFARNITSTFYRCQLAWTRAAELLVPYQQYTYYPPDGLGEVQSHQLRTTINVECPEWLDWFYGALQFQAVHHLFPRLPRHNLRRAQGLCLRVLRED
ncbi:hypothetical protein E8E12_001790 [Didymella heteroderae]|uniref:Fatty acid desaturase domain-containing protein n=1 Tax=Didymella heteroderae TaxID=1769908 RepID=A0A9P4WGK1_9PLEO|nr:hypothetical protein E8E12_001790 [Didymella heteroderae]